MCVTVFGHEFQQPLCGLQSSDPPAGKLLFRLWEHGGGVWRPYQACVCEQQSAGAGGSAAGPGAADGAHAGDTADEDAQQPLRLLHRQGLLITSD